MINVQPYLDVVLFPGLVPQDVGGGAGHVTAQESTENSILVQALGVLVSLAGEAAPSKEAWEVEIREGRVQCVETYRYHSCQSS